MAILTPVDPNQRHGDAGQYRVEQGYVMGLAFNTARDRVVLILKNKPRHLAGRWNGVGGKIESGFENGSVLELAEDAMAREFREETGIITNPKDWEYFGVMEGSWGYVVLYRLFNDAIETAASTTDELVGVFDVSHLPNNILDNTQWMIGVALDPSNPKIAIDYPE